MFKIEMSPKVLNVEKLEKKFGSLTKSRESILGVSTWIIRHKECYKEIVDQWLDALSRDVNSALTMFYVANDVIQNCGRKKAPEFREAFASVLEKAVSLEKVKYIKKEVIRMLTLWHERSIYDSEFFKKLQDKLNTSEGSQSEEEICEADVIANFKLDNLIDSVQKLKDLAKELLHKEAFLEDIEEPVIMNIDNLIVKMESQREIRKIDKFQNLVEDYLSFADKVLAARKNTLHNLKYSNVFYNAQHEDAKKVAQAYRIYEKKVKNVATALFEKQLLFPEPSPVFSDESLLPTMELGSSPECQSSGVSEMPMVINEISNEASNSEVCISPKFSDCESPPPEIKSLSSTAIAITKLSSHTTKESEKSAVVDKYSHCEGIISPEIKEIVKSTSNEKVAKTADRVKNNENLLKSPIADTTSTKKMLKSPIRDGVSAKHSLKIAVSDTVADQTFMKSPICDGVTTKKLKSPVSDAVKDKKLLRSPVPDAVSTKALRSPVPDTVYTKQLLKSPVLDATATKEALKNQVNFETIKKVNKEKRSKSPLVNITKITNNDNIMKRTNIVEAEKQEEKEINSKIRDLKNKDINEEKKPGTVIHDNDNLIKKSMLEKVEILSTSKVIDSSGSKETSGTESQALSDVENIDFLLEKAYNDHHSKTKASFKRKIENLLKLKQSSKACKLSTDDNSMDSQESKIVSDSDVTVTPSQIEGDENVLGQKKSDDSSELSVISKETPVAVENENNLEKVTEAAISEATVKPKADQVVEVPQSSEVSTSCASKDNPVSSFQSFPDIPTELLKNILDKHRINMNISHVESNSGDETPGLKTENSKQSDLNSASERTTTQVNQSSTLEIITSCTSETQISDANFNIQEKNVGSSKSHIQVDKDILSVDSASNIDSAQKDDSVNSTPFLENLHNVLRCFTEKETEFSHLQNSKILNTLPSIPLENTLKIYSCIMQHCNNVNALSSSSNINNETQSSVQNNSSVSNINSMQDNLEIMDMEVDSDDENMQ